MIQVSDSDLNCNVINNCFLTRMLYERLHSIGSRLSHFIPSHRHSYSIVVIKQYNSKRYDLAQNKIGTRKIVSFLLHIFGI